MPKEIPEKLTAFSESEQTKRRVNQLIDWAHSVEERLKPIPVSPTCHACCWDVIEGTPEPEHTCSLAKPFRTQIDMETPKIKSVEEVTGETHLKWLTKSETAKLPKYGELTVLPYGFLSQAVNQVLTQDRASLHTSLVAAVEEKRRTRTYPVTKKLSRKSARQIQDEKYNQGIDDTLTIINSIFKE